MKPLLYIVPILMLSHLAFANEYWQRQIESLQKEQKQVHKQPYASFVLEYIDARLAMAQELSALYHESLNNKHSEHAATTHYVTVLSQCFDDAAINITRQQVIQQLQPLQTSDTIDCTTNDYYIIHTELVLASITSYTSTGIEEKDNDTMNNDMSAPGAPPMANLSASVRFNELYQKACHTKQKAEYIQSILTLCSGDTTSTAQYMHNPSLLLQLFPSLAAKIHTKTIYSNVYNSGNGIPYQITIPHEIDSQKAVNDINAKRDELIATSTVPTSEIDAIAHAYIDPVHDAIAEQQKLLATMQSINGITIENEEALNTFIEHYTTQSRYLLDYAQANTLYCNLVQFKEPAIDYQKRYEHIATLAHQLQQQTIAGDSSGKTMPAIERIVSILKAFACTQHKKENDAAVQNLMQSLHTIKEAIRNHCTAPEKNNLNSALCTIEIAAGIETIEKGIHLFQSQHYAKEALINYATLVNEAFEHASTGYGSNILQQIVTLQSAIPAVSNFDIQKIINEYASQRYLLRKLRYDCASLVQRLQFFEKQGIAMPQKDKAFQLLETIKTLQPLYSVDVYKYKINQGNIIIIDRQCAAALTRMSHKNKMLTAQDI
ncbi:MAG TPA: hypothetical protein PLZ38_10175 [Spirochaetota bacterium]|nr:hypothetical protein [Spirochaetota bacterium]